MQLLCKLGINRFTTCIPRIQNKDMADFTKQAQPQSFIAFLSRSQYTNLARHGNEQLNTSNLESQKQDQKTLTFEF